MKTNLAIPACLLFLAGTVSSFGQLRFEDAINYADGELNSTTSGIWRVRDVPLAMVESGGIVVDHTKGNVFDGAYQYLWPSPSSKEIVCTSFRLTVTAAPEEEVGFNFAGIADVDIPDLYRSRVFMKKGRAPDTFRLGMSISSALPVTSGGDPNAFFFKADLQLNEEYLILTYWDNVNLVARLYIDSNDINAPKVELTGGTPRNNGFRRFGIRMNSGNHLGRYIVDDIKAGEDFDSVLQSFTSKPPFVLDAPFIPEAPGEYEDTILGWHSYLGNGWTFWLAGSESSSWGLLYIAARDADDGSGWIYHQLHGWIYVLSGSIENGIIAYSTRLGWIHILDGYGDDYFYAYSPGGWLRWNAS